MLAAAALVRATGAEVYIASTLDGPLGHRGCAALRRGAAGRCAVRAGDARLLEVDDPCPPREGAHDRATGPGARAANARPSPRRVRVLSRHRCAVAARSPPPRPPGASRGRPCPAPARPRARRRAARREPLAERAELRVALAGHHRRRHRQLAQAVPQRRHRTGADAAQRRGEAGRAVAQDLRVRSARRPRAGRRRTAAAPSSGRRTPRCVLLDSVRGRAPRRRRGAPRARPRSSMPAVVETSTSRSTRSGAAARRAARAGRPSSSRARTKRSGAAVEHAPCTQAPKSTGRASPAARGRAGRARPAVRRPAVARRPAPSSRRCPRTRAGATTSIHRRGPYAAGVHVLLRAFVDELARCGMRAACTSPGSRSTPLVLALAREPGWRPSPTSTSAARRSSRSATPRRPAGRWRSPARRAPRRAHYAPAVIEAHEARVPLIVLTADRPPELREIGAGQTIDQIKLFGGAAKWFFEVGDHEATPERLRWMRTLACRRLLDGGDRPPRPRAPELRRCASRSCPTASCPPTTRGRADGRPFVTRIAPVAQLAPDALQSVAEIVAGTPRGVVVAGREERTPDLPAAVEAFGAARRLPGARRPAVGRARAARRGRPLRRAAARRGVRRRPAARPGHPRRRPADVQAAARVAGRRSTPPRSAIDPDGAWQDPDARRRPLARPRPRVDARRAGQPRAPHARPRLAARPGATPTPRPRARSTSRSATALSEPRVAAELGGDPAAAGDRLRRLLDAGARRRDVLRRARGRRRACWPTAAPTASTGWCRPPTAWPPRGWARSCC